MYTGTVLLDYVRHLACSVAVGLRPVVPCDGTRLLTRASITSSIIRTIVLVIGSVVPMLPALTKRRSIRPFGTSSSSAMFTLTRLVYRLTSLALVPNIRDIPCPEVFTVCRTLTLPACLSIETHATTLTTTDDIISDMDMNVTSIQETMPTTAAIESTTRLMQLAQMTPLVPGMAPPQLATVPDMRLPLLKSLAQTPTAEGMLWSIMLNVVRPLLHALAEMHRLQTPISMLREVAVTHRLKSLVSRRLSTVVAYRLFVVDRLVRLGRVDRVDRDRTTVPVTPVPLSMLSEVIQAPVLVVPVVLLDGENVRLPSMLWAPLPLRLAMTVSEPVRLTSLLASVWAQLTLAVSGAVEVLPTGPIMFMTPSRLVELKCLVTVLVLLLTHAQLLPVLPIHRLVVGTTVSPRFTVAVQLTPLAGAPIALLLPSPPTTLAQLSVPSRFSLHSAASGIPPLLLSMSMIRLPLAGYVFPIMWQPLATIPSTSRLLPVFGTTLRNEPGDVSALAPLASTATRTSATLDTSDDRFTESTCVVPDAELDPVLTAMLPVAISALLGLRSNMENPMLHAHRTLALLIHR